ncbi:MAG: hypothetical protein C0606_06325 [Hyphomicrobiales bacterium]|nr:MAG: hypothetical protein C0606_06325 [Hyphomicrobiales bacterium]
MTGQTDKTDQAFTDASLRTARLVLRRPCAADLPAIVPLLDNANVSEMTSRIPHPYTMADAQGFLAALNEPGNLEDLFFVLKRDGGNETLIGACGTMEADEKSREIGYWLGEPFWRQGYAAEAARAVVDYTFAKWPVSELIARSRTDNGASLAVLAKLGFAETGCGSCSSKAAGASFPATLFSLTRERWEEARGGGGGGGEGPFLGELFAGRIGVQWGLRGDPPLWEAMEVHFARTPLPASRNELRVLLTDAFTLLTGAHIDDPSRGIEVLAFRRGGMSSGLVSPKFWRETGLPEIEQRWTDAQSRQTANHG